MPNPYVAKLKKAEQRLDVLEKRQRHYDAIAIPGTLVTGRSGISASYKKRLDRQVEKTIDLACALVEQRRKVATLQQSVQMYDEGKINAQGRSISPTRQVVRAPKDRDADRRLFIANYPEAITSLEVNPDGLNDFVAFCRKYGFSVNKMAWYMVSWWG